MKPKRARCGGRCSRFDSGTAALRAASLALGISVLTAAGCHRDMWEQPKLGVYEESEFFGDGQSARGLVPGTVPRGHLQEDEHLYKGRVGKSLAQSFPFRITKQVLERGQDRYNIFCSPCHGRAGDGLGMIVQRGYLQPSSFHNERLRKAPPGYFYDALLNGTGPAKVGLAAGQDDKVHPPIAKPLAAEDRWAIVAYIRALQLSQNMRLDELTRAEREELLNPKAKEPANGQH